VAYAKWLLKYRCISREIVSSFANSMNNADQSFSFIVCGSVLRESLLRKKFAIQLVLCMILTVDNDDDDNSCCSTYRVARLSSRINRSRVLPFHSRYERKIGMLVSQKSSPDKSR
jgi:hypothetical protein